MNELLQKHGCANVFTIPEGLKELMSDISREVLREQPEKIFDFIANYLSVLLITREHGILAVRILDDLCDCKPSVSDHLLQLGMERTQAAAVAQVMKEEIEEFEPEEGKEKVRELQIMKRVLMKNPLDEDMAGKVCQVARNAYRDYWYRKKLLEQSLKVKHDEPWEIAAQRTLELYKKTKPSFSELTRAAQKIQAAYRGYHVRRNLLRHLKVKPKKTGAKFDLPGPPLDVAASREIDLGPVIDINVREDDVSAMLDEAVGEQLGLQYDPMRTITHIEDEEILEEHIGTASSRTSKVQSRMGGLASSKSLASRSQFGTSKQSRFESQIEPRQSRLPSQMPSKIEATSRHSRLPSMIQEGPRQSRLPSVMPSETAPQRSRMLSQMPEVEPRKSVIPNISQETSIHKISFAAAPVVLDEIDDEDEMKEDETQEVQEIQDELQAGTPAKSAETEAALDVAEIVQEVLEDLPDDRTEGDGESVPIVSIPSSALETPGGTDVEDDLGEMDTSAEEG